MKLACLSVLMLAQATSDAAESLHFQNWNKVYDAFSDLYQDGAMSDSGTIAILNQAEIVMTSANGIDWVAKTLPVQTILFKVLYHGGKFILGGGHDTSIDGTSKTLFGWSTDGFNWTLLEKKDGGGMVRGIAVGNGEYVAITGKGLIYRSTDGMTWALDPTPLAYGLTDIEYGDGVYVACDHAFRTYVSLDATDWQVQPNPHAGGFGGGRVAFGNGFFVINSASPLPHPVIWSPDGYNWTSLPDFPHYGDAPGFAKIAFGQGQFIATTRDRRFATSLDGWNWRIEGPPVFPPGYPQSPIPLVMAAGHGRAYAAGPGILRSPEYSTLSFINPAGSDLLLYGRPGSRHLLEYLSGGVFTTDWAPLREVEIGSNGSVATPNWISAESGSKVIRARAIP